MLYRPPGYEGRAHHLESARQRGATRPLQRGMLRARTITEVYQPGWGGSPNTAEVFSVGTPWSPWAGV
jgi:hypothetical protein